MLGVAVVAPGASTVLAVPAPSAQNATARQVAASKAAASNARDHAAKARERLEALAPTRKQLRAAIKTEQAEFAKHWHAAQAAYPLSPIVPPPAPAKPGKKKPLPKVESLRTAKTEYGEVGRVGAALFTDGAALRRADDEAAQQSEAATGAASQAKSSSKDAQEQAKAVAKQAQDSAQAAKKDKSNAATQAALGLKAEADLARADAKEAQAAATAADQEASKSRTLSGLGTAQAYAAKKAAADKDEDKLKTNLESARRTLKEVDAALDAQSPLIKGCDLRNVDWKNMTYPWYPYGTKEKPLKLTDGFYVCDEEHAEDCPQMAPSIETPLFGDLAGDGSQNVAVEISIEFPELQFYDVMFFGKEADCHLRFLGSTPRQTTNGAIQGHAYVADLPYAKRGESMGLGSETGVEHVEWRLIKGKLKQTVDVKK
jgi:hypothetical protein